MTPPNLEQLEFLRQRYNALLATLPLPLQNAVPHLAQEPKRGAIGFPAELNHDQLGCVLIKREISAFEAKADVSWLRRNFVF